MIEVKQLRKNFGDLAILKNLSFQVPTGTWASLTGPSGSGKTTLLGLLAGLDAPSGGSIHVLGTDFANLDEDGRADFRAHNMGFVFQSFRLIPYLTALENVEVPLRLINASDASQVALRMLERVGLGDRAHHKPTELSGGEQQRVAVARAFVTRPKLLFADEPTGNLDSKNGARILELIRELHAEDRSTLVIVTHDPEIARAAELQLRMRDGELVS